MDYNEKSQQVRDKITEVVEFFPTFSVKPVKDNTFVSYVEVCDLHGRSFSFYIAMHKTNPKAEVMGQYPRFGSQYFGPQNGNAPRINVSLSRPAKAIAADVRRRFLPQYLAAYDEAVIQRRKAIEERRLLTFNANALAALFSKEKPYGSHERPTVSGYLNDGSTNLLKLEGYSSDRWNVDVTLGYDTARALAAFLLNRKVGV